MATYYVRPDGNDGNAGTAPAANQAWKTIQKALSASPGLVGGDIVYVAPGHYLEQVTIAITSPSSTVQIIGDVTASQFSGLSAGIVRLSGYTSAGNTAVTFSNSILKGTSKNNLSFSNFIFEGKGTGASAGNALVSFLTSQNISFRKCLFSQQGYGPGPATGSCLEMTAPVGLALNATISKCVFEAAVIPLYLLGRNVSDTSSVKDCIFIGGQYNIIAESVQCVIQNNTFNGASVQSIFLATGSASFKSQVRNNLFLYCLTAMNSSSTTHQDEDYNRIIGASTARTNVTAGANSTVVGSSRLSYGYARMVGLSASDFWTPEQNSPNQGFGTATGAEATDVYSTAWTGATPDAGYQTYTVINALTPTYQPTERNASTITIAPGSTSQSIELYLGATGLTASTSGLSARYNRTRTASVSIPLVARTIAQAWTSGGFAEVDATNMPGVYRLDLPDAALAAGADDVTVMVRGASGTNGAVMTVKLSSGGLTSAQTASAVWGASPAGYNDATTFGGVVNQIDQTVTGTSVLVQDVPSNVWQEQTDDHTTHGTFGYNILRADAPSKEGLVTLHQSGGISRVDADIHAIVNDTAAAAELKGALLHTGGDYISADLLTPVTSAQTVRIGPFAVRTDAGGADGALDLNQSTAGAVVVQLTDAQGTGIDQTSATVQAKVYNVAGGLVATYTCTPAYAVNGFVSIPMTTAVTGTAGSYIINLWSTVGATVIIYGPLQLRVRAI